MDQIETKNAKIDGTFLGVEDHGIFTFYLYLSYGGAGQGAGGYGLDSYDEKTNKRVGYKRGIQLIMEILKVVGVNTWEELKGKHIRVKADMGRVYEIGNFLKDDWLNFEEFFK